MKPLHRNRNRRLSLTAGLGLTLTISSVLADAPKPDAAQQSLGIMKFANVQVVATENTVTAPVKQANAEGLRAYVDPTTRRLRGQTIEERKKIADEFATRQADKASRARAQASSAGAQDSHEDIASRTLFGPGGSVGVQLTEEHMIFQVAHKTSDGLIREELIGKSAAKQAVTAHNNTLKDKETNHAH